MKRFVPYLLAPLLAAGPALAHGPMKWPPDGGDPRIEVKMPPELRIATLGNMRDHLLAIQQITAYLADKDFDQAADTAESRLGLSSMEHHGAHEIAPYLPAGMRELGHRMHAAASDLAVAARDAKIDGDVGPTLRALATVQGSCVNCHAAFRFK